MTPRTMWATFLVGVMTLAAGAPSGALARGSHDAIEVDVVDDRGHEFRQYPVRTRGFATRAYVEAKPERNYAIRVRNNTDRRIGLVVAVDGRNIISGAKSDLANDERMYILRPHETAEYEGWRTGKNRVNRFYFTDAGDSYADAFGDNSAMGVIAVAAYPERDRRARHDDDRSYSAEGRAMKPQSAQPGTGFGESEWSPSRRVDFDPERSPIAKHFIKYEWRKHLCRKGIIDCHEHRPPPQENRFWPGDMHDGVFAPPPPNRRPSPFGYPHDNWD